MAIIMTTPVTHTYETTFEKNVLGATPGSVTTETVTVKHAATFNGKIYNGKRYINDTYRVNNTNSGLKTHTHIWQDGMGWVDGGNATLVKLFNLK